MYGLELGVQGRGHIARLPAQLVISNNRTQITPQQQNRYTKSTFYTSVEHEFSVSAGCRATQSLQTTTPFTDALVDERLW